MKQFILVLFYTFLYCQGQSQVSFPIQDKSVTGGHDYIEFTVLQINDFYEIAGMDQGTIGGASRISTLRKKLLSEQKNVLTVLAGDFLSPTLLGTLKLDGSRINGKQMVEVLNKAGIDLVTFGNHEFDIDVNSLQKRINESGFDWVSTNVLHRNQNSIIPFYKEHKGSKTDIPKHKIITLQNISGKEFKIGIVAPCLPANKVSYVHYEDMFESVRVELEKISGKVDFIISLSHLNKEDDLKMAKMFPQINLILGGHEHEHMKYKIGKTLMTKADANARSAYVHRIRYHFKNQKSKIKSKLVILDKSIIKDPEVEQIVQRWKSIETKIIRDMGFDPDEVLISLPQPYDARELIIRNQVSEFCQMICKAMTRTSSQSDCSILNSGSIRVDDVFKTKLSQYDILRALPYGGGIIKVEMRGSLLKQILEAGLKNKGTGGFLQWDKIAVDHNKNWFVSGELLDERKIYHVCLTDFLLTGLETGLDFLTKNNAEIISIQLPAVDNPEDLRRDIRMAVIDYLKRGGR
jgi:2',3'-cyclic-nucleotide 2'-phosphodiesterase (5'-nucleotidase family)